MKKIFMKKQALVLTLIAALGVAVYLNYFFADNGVSSTAKKETDSALGEAVFVNDTDTDGVQQDDAVAVSAKTGYFEQARKNREQAREEAVDLIKDIAADIQTDSTAAQKAIEQTKAVALAITQENNIENLIKAKGFADCVAYIANEKCSVVVKGDSLTPAQTLQISEIITAQSQIAAQNINIMAVNS